MTEAALRGMFPWIQWDEPVPVSVPETGAHALACRVCIAQLGLHGSDVGNLPQSREEFDAHMREFHPRG